MSRTINRVLLAVFLASCLAAFLFVSRAGAIVQTPAPVAVAVAADNCRATVVHCLPQIMVGSRLPEIEKASLRRNDVRDGQVK